MQYRSLVLAKIGLSIFNDITFCIIKSRFLALAVEGIVNSYNLYISSV